MASLGTSAGSKSRILLEQGDGAQNLDRVFNLLYQEYRRDEVDEAVNRILRIPRNANIGSRDDTAAVPRCHRSTTGRHDQLRSPVRARGHISANHVGPALPDIRSVGSFEGLAYLHGRRWNPEGSGASSGKELILSSSDFGRAYLADGWATRFVRELLQNYFIVLVGYSASDPPVRHLLEGLQSRRESQSSTIYAFDNGEVDEVVDRWRSLGVQALPYQHRRIPTTPHCGIRSARGLFGPTIPTSGVYSIVALAQRSPTQLEPFQRGQVAGVGSNLGRCSGICDRDLATLGRMVVRVR